MKILFCGLITALAIAGLAEIITPQARAVLERRRAVARERITIDDATYWVTTYKRGAAFDGAVTNKEVKIIGAKQKNYIEIKSEAREAIIKAIRARAVEKAAYYRELEKKAVLNSSKVIWREVAEANEGLIKLIDEGGEK